MGLEDGDLSVPLVSISDDPEQGVVDECTMTYVVTFKVEGAYEDDDCTILGKAARACCWPSVLDTQVNIEDSSARIRFQISYGVSYGDVQEEDRKKSLKIALRALRKVIEDAGYLVVPASQTGSTGDEAALVQEDQPSRRRPKQSIWSRGALNTSEIALVVSALVTIGSLLRSIVVENRKAKRSKNETDRDGDEKDDCGDKIEASGNKVKVQVEEEDNDVLDVESGSPRRVSMTSVSSTGSARTSDGEGTSRSRGACISAIMLALIALLCLMDFSYDMVTRAMEDEAMYRNSKATVPAPAPVANAYAPTSSLRPSSVVQLTRSRAQTLSTTSSPVAAAPPATRPSETSGATNSSWSDHNVTGNIAWPFCQEEDMPNVSNGRTWLPAVASGKDHCASMCHSKAGCDEWLWVTTGNLTHVSSCWLRHGNMNRETSSHSEPSPPHHATSAAHGGRNCFPGSSSMPIGRLDSSVQSSTLWATRLPTSTSTRQTMQNLSASDKDAVNVTLRT